MSDVPTLYLTLGLRPQYGGEMELSDLTCVVIPVTLPQIIAWQQAVREAEALRGRLGWGITLSWEVYDVEIYPHAPTWTERGDFDEDFYESLTLKKPWACLVHPYAGSPVQQLASQWASTQGPCPIIVYAEVSHVGMCWRITPGWHPTIADTGEVTPELWLVDLQAVEIFLLDQEGI